MKKIVLLSVIAVSLFGKINAQCAPDLFVAGLGLPGVYPPELAIPGVPMVGISDGIVGSLYSQTLTLVVLEDTTWNIASFLPTAAVTAMNLAGISTVMAVDVNHVTFDVQGLPNGISSQCDTASCQYPSATLGCIQLSGTPAVSGTFSVPVNMTVNIQLPPINIPLYGLLGGMGQDIPTFSAQTYDLLVTDATAINEVSNYRSKVFPNPTSNQAVLSLISFSDVVVYNILGKEVLIANNVKGDLLLSKNDIGKGVFHISVQSKNKTETIKLIIN